MKLIPFIIFNIIAINSNLSINIKPSDIFKRGNSEKNISSKNKTNLIISNNDYHLKDKKDLGNIRAPLLPRRIEPIRPIKLIVPRKPIRPLINMKKEAKSIFRPNKKKIDEEIKYQKCSSLAKGSLFIACCVKGGLTSDAQFLKACKWALESNYIKNEYHINISSNDFTKKVSKEFQTTYHDDWKIKESNRQGHYFVIDSRKKIIFDSAGFRNHGY